MFIGHFGLGLAGKKVTNKPSLAILFLAAQFLDLLWPFFLLMGIEKVAIEEGNTAFTPLNFISHPYSHSLLMAVLWAVLFGGIYYVNRRDVRASVVLGFLVVSHWILELFTHRPDLPLTPWTANKPGVGLWNHPTATMIIEVSMFLPGCYFYISATEPKNNIGRLSLLAFIVCMLLVYFMNVFGPPAESVQMISVVGLTQWIIIGWAGWIDKNRSVVHSGQQ